MKDRESLAVTAAGFSKFIYLVFLEAMPTPPIVWLYADPWSNRSPIPNRLYGEYPLYAPLCALAAKTPAQARMRVRSILLKARFNIIYL